MGARLTFPRSLLAGDVTAAARALVGATLTSLVEGASVTLRILEVEAYGGADDPASHAWRGVTDRTRVMFGPAGHAYVYFSYGMHWCLNVSAGPDGEGAAVLLRAGTVLEGAAVVAARRPGVPPRDWARGPGRLTRALAVTGACTGVDLCLAASELTLTPAPSAPAAVASGPRVGVSRAADRPWRYWLAGAPGVSSYRRSPRAGPLTDSGRD